MSSLQPYGPSLTRLLCPWDSPGKNTGVGCQALLQGIVPTQGSSLSLLHLLHWHVSSLPLASPWKPVYISTNHQTCFPGCKNTPIENHWVRENDFYLFFRGEFGHLQVLNPPSFSLSKSFLQHRLTLLGFSRDRDWGAEGGGEEGGCFEKLKVMCFNQFIDFFFCLGELTVPFSFHPWQQCLKPVLLK